MRVRVVTPPPPVVSWEDADAHLKLDGDETQKALVEGLIAAATGHLDGPAGWLGRALGPQTLEARAERFWSPGRLPYPPHISIESVKYVDANGVLQTVSPDQYELEGGELLPAHGFAWPSVRGDRGGVRLRYRAGYVADPVADPLVPALPAPIRAAILLMVGDLYRFRETAVSGTIAASIPMSATVENLLATFRVFA
jgi:uncharacterized phiE125 gp8 family phage protein